MGNKVNSKRVLFYMLATIEFTFLHKTYEAKAHHIIIRVSEAMNSLIQVVSVKADVEHAYLNKQSTSLGSHF